MADLNEDLRKWNNALDEGRALRLKLKKDALGMRDGLLRRNKLRLARFVDRFVSIGERWRDKDLGGSDD